MKKLRLKKWVKVVLVIIILVLLGVAVNKLNNDYMKGCMSNGYSKDYCEAHK